ncbi:ribosome small subunit-dependent GTPase A [Ureaplasma canigenitalium]|uniref:ribosome small subunit-dependent GTPase A n=1 Tax=Ureaplasma canigenitalium TaxID=42092 RepID=UPI0004E234C0|nr:ribosome small subunit-dependent GTPase A [Ureaplasma canigenitalium]
MEVKVVRQIKDHYFGYFKEQKTIIKIYPRGIFKHDKHELKPIVGDDVIVKLVDDLYIIDEIKERKNRFIRPRIANLDIILIVMSATKPTFNVNLLCRFLALYDRYQIKDTIIVITKTDLVEDTNQVFQYINDLRKDGYQVLLSNRNEDIDYLKSIIKDHVVCLVGNSGVGKSTLINKIDHTFNRHTQEISLSLNRGKHTTTNTHLLNFNDGYLVDTPGFSTILLNMTKKELSTSFKDFNQIAPLCKFSDCLHTNEPGCRIREAVDEKTIAKWRYDEYLKLLNLVDKEKK